MKAGFICSAGGAPVFAAIELLNHCGLATRRNFFLIADRDCGAIKKAMKLGISNKIIPYRNCVQFSEHAAKLLRDYHICILLYSRKVCAELYSRMPTWNIHPGLLPDFSGLGAVKKAHDRQCAVLGATLHLVTEEIDAGPILGIISEYVNPASGIEFYNKISFLQKTLLILFILEKAEKMVVNPATISSDSHKKEPPHILNCLGLDNQELFKEYIKFRRHELETFEK